MMNVLKELTREQVKEKLIAEGFPVHTCTRLYDEYISGDVLDMLDEIPAELVPEIGLRIMLKKFVHKFKSNPIQPTTMQQITNFTNQKHNDENETTGLNEFILPKLSETLEKKLSDRKTCWEAVSLLIKELVSFYSVSDYEINRPAHYECICKSILSKYPCLNDYIKSICQTENENGIRKKVLKEHRYLSGLFSNALRKERHRIKQLQNAKCQGTNESNDKLTDKSNESEFKEHSQENSEMSVKTELVEYDENYSPQATKRKYSHDGDSVSKRSKVTSSSPSSSLSSYESDTFEPLNENYVINFFNNLKQNLQTVPYDVTFVLAGAHHVHAHKILVLNSSSFFTNLLSKNLQSTPQVYINLPGIQDYESFQFCINFIQNGRLSACKNEKLYDYKKMAMILQLNDLVEQLQVLIEKYELDTSYSNFRAILSNFYTTINQNYLSQSQKFDELKTIVSKNPNFVFDTINRDFMIKEKYIYESQLISEQSMDLYLENFKYFDLKKNGDDKYESGSENFKRNTLVIFSLDSTGSNYVLRTKLNYTDATVLNSGIKDLFESLLKEVTDKKYRLQLNRICYLKKPSNCKTIKLETIKTSTDCFRAIVEYSRSNASKELPFVLVTCHLSVNF